MIDSVMKDTREQRQEIVIDAEYFQEPTLSLVSTDINDDATISPLHCNV